MKFLIVFLVSLSAFTASSDCLHEMNHLNKLIEENPREILPANAKFNDQIGLYILQGKILGRTTCKIAVTYDQFDSGEDTWAMCSLPVEVEAKEEGIKSLEIVEDERICFV